MKYGFGSFENLKELNANNDVINFGDYGMDLRLGRRENVDPKASKYPSQSPYSGFNGNPIYYEDPTGESGEASINKQSKTITVEQHLVFYGSKAETKLSRVTANEIATQYNNANAKVNIGGVEYSVKFKVTYGTVTEADATKMASTNTSAKNNFIRVEENNTRHNRSFNEIGENNGFMNTDDNLGTSTTAPHEIAHGYGLTHSAGDQRGSGQPDIMAARGTLVDAKYQYDPKAKAGAAGGTINPATRQVTQGNVSDMFKRVTFDKNGKADIGKATNRIYESSGNEKKKTP
ncbi:unnamed protein product [Rotaria socialis]|uniref:Uncharacterized protein n=1 Tax=Rotaria socialis TaxID=392032 RepID=A0A820RLI2_9BILA|nr:unnamed protein product [Rotaria socialis]CAF3478486.1 unnamed protein product [Rotaria socialis]CAF4439082.1 unnamed protein product [Rotaria socialis]CAF4502878.1 unnamed protein product [Rotaria socialis]